MSIFGSIMSSIFGGPAQAAPPPASQPSSVASPSAPAAAQPASSAPAAAHLTASPPTKAQTDVAAVMDKLAEESDEDLDWRHSIVDLMKLLKLDSSLAARKQLAEELQYTGNTKDSATMNIWLHKQVMLKVAENGGKVPADLKH